MEPKSQQQKIDFWGTVASSESFMGGVYSVACGGHLCLVCAVCDVTIWHHTHFQINLLAKFVDNICIFFYIHSPYFMCHCTEYKLLLHHVRLSEENTLNAETQQFITAKISDWALKQGSKTHPSLRQRNLQLNYKMRLRYNVLSNTSSRA